MNPSELRFEAAYQFALWALEKGVMMFKPSPAEVDAVITLMRQGISPEVAAKRVYAASRLEQQRADHVCSLIEAELPASRAVILAHAHG